MRHRFLRLLPALLAVVTILATLPAVSAAPSCGSGELYEKSARGLMPPVCLPAEGALQLAAADAPTVPFLAAPVNATVGSWAQVLAATDVGGTGQATAALLTAQNFDPANDKQLQLFNQSGGSLSRVQQLPGGAAPEAITALDVNLDGRRDLVAALAGDDALAVYTHTLDTSALNSPTTLPVVGAPNALALADFSGDLRPDLAVVAPQAHSIRLWQSTQTGLVARAAGLPYASDGYDALASGDLDNDGYDDLVALRGAGYSTGAVVVYLQQHGSFPISTTLSPQLGGYLPQSLAVGDVNGDGLDDVVVTAGGNQPDAYLSVFLQGPTGLATTPITYPAYHLPSAVVVSDVNHDGREDVVVAHDGWRTVSVYTQNASGTLDPYAVATVPYSSRYRPNALAVADLNGDGGLDVALVSRTPGLTVLNNTAGAPVAGITSPAPYATVPSGAHTVTGTTTAGSTAVEVRVKGLTAWAPATLTGTTWSATVNLPATNRPWTIEARAVNGARYQAPPASVRVRANGRVRDGLLVEYQFAERSGTTVHDTSAVGTPLDLTLADEQAVSRVPDGIFVHTPTRIASPAAATKVTGALQGANAFTLEAWVRTANLRQDGPAHMLSLTSDAQPLNLALVQTHVDDRSARVGLLLNTSTAPNDPQQSLAFAELPLSTGLTHLMVTHAADGTVSFYLNGVAQGSSVVAGDFSGWDASAKLVFANDAMGDHPWLGEYHLAAIYQRALTLDEVDQNYAAGPVGDGSPAQITDAQLVYTFNEGSGTTVGDSSLVLPALPAQIADVTKVRWGAGSLTVNAPTIIATESAATKVSRASMATGEISIEAWITPANTTQSGPAQILSIGKSNAQYNLVLAQGEWGNCRADHYVAHLRGTGPSHDDDEHDDDEPYHHSPPGSLTPALTYVVYTRDAAGTEQLFINGEAQDSGHDDGDISNWDASYRLALANALTMNRAWLGTYHALTISSRALNATQIGTRFHAGPEGDGVTPPATSVGLFVQQVVVNGGAETTTSHEVTLDMTIQVPSGQTLDQVTVAEYGFDPQHNLWHLLQRGRPTSVATGGYRWTLRPGAGVRYLQVWATDSAGTTSSYPYQTLINVVPERIALEHEHTDVYRFALHAGESFTAQVAVLDGDADLYVWGPSGDSTMRWVSNGRGDSEQVNFTAPVNGVYQVEVRGYSHAAYRLTVTHGTATPVATMTAATVTALADDKVVADLPAIALDSAPTLSVSNNTVVFLPLIIR